MDEQKQTLPVFSATAIIGAVICIFTARFLAGMVVLATLGFSALAFYRREKPSWLPALPAAAAAIVAMLFIVPWPVAPETRASELYKDSSWQYLAYKDEMRGQINRSASLRSLTDISLKPPYDGSNSAEISFSGPESTVTLRIDKGQLECDYGRERVAVKIDDHPVEYFRCSSPVGGDARNLMFIDESIGGTRRGSHRSLASLIPGARSLIIEADVFDAGPYQFKFNVAGFDENKLENTSP